VREALRMGRNGRGHVLDGIEPVDVGESGRESADDATNNATPTKKASDQAQYATRTFRTVALAGGGHGWRRGPVSGGVPPACTSGISARCSNECHFAAVTAVRSTGGSLPVFEQNWRLFAPDSESVTRQILSRTMRAPPRTVPNRSAIGSI
jgi:hypothetical protein